MNMKELKEVELRETLKVLVKLMNTDNLTKKFKKNIKEEISILACLIEEL